MLKLNKIHHIAIICSNYEQSKRFYVEILGFNVIREIFREERNSYKLDLEVGGQYQIELFSFPNPTPRPSRPEAAGLRHLAFEVDDIDEAIFHLNELAVVTEPIRT
jgi:glyoxylase I family protein